MTDLTKEELKAWQNHLDKWRKDGVLPQPKMIYKAGLNDGRSESQKRITELEKALKIIEIKWNDSTARITELEDVLRDIGDHCYDADAQRRALDAIEGGGE